MKCCLYTHEQDQLHPIYADWPAANLELWIPTWWLPSFQHFWVLKHLRLKFWFQKSVLRKRSGFLSKCHAFSVPFGRARSTFLPIHDCWVPYTINWEVLQQFLGHFVVNIQKQGKTKHRKNQTQNHYKMILLSLWKNQKGIPSGTKVLLLLPTAGHWLLFHIHSLIPYHISTKVTKLK